MFEIFWGDFIVILHRPQTENTANSLQAATKHLFEYFFHKYLLLFSA